MLGAGRLYRIHQFQSKHGQRGASWEAKEGPGRSHNRSKGAPPVGRVDCRGDECEPHPRHGPHRKLLQHRHVGVAAPHEHQILQRGEARGAQGGQRGGGRARRWRRVGGTPSKHGHLALLYDLRVLKIRLTGCSPRKRRIAGIGIVVRARTHPHGDPRRPHSLHGLQRC